MNEFEVKNELIKKREDIKTFDDLVTFLKDVKDNYNCGYGEAPRAIAQACLAVGWYLSGEFGITGFQAGCVVWDFITGWTYTHNKTGLKMVDYDDMLFPQYEDKFTEKTIKPWVWDALQEEAKKMLESSEYDNPRVIEHWKSIVNGNVPFGYSVKDD